MTKASYGDMSSKSAGKMLGSEIGSMFDIRERMFSYYGDGTVYDYSSWSEADMKTAILRDGQMAALEAVITLPIRQCPWAIVADKDDKGEAEFVRSVLEAPPTGGGMSTPMQTVVGQATAAQIYKKAYFEKVFKIRPEDGMVVYDKLAYRPPSTCEVRRKVENAEFDGFRQQVWLFGGLKSHKQKTPGYVDIPKNRSFVYVHGKHREPLQGISELDLAYTAYTTKMKLLYLWYTFLENQALPKVAVYGEDEPEAEQRADDLASLRSSGIVGWKRNPPDMKSFEIIESSGIGAAQFQEALSFLETWQTSSVLAGFTGLSSLASLGRGSLALSSDQSAFFLKSRQAITHELQTDITQDVLSPLVAYNFGTNAAFPSFQFGPLIDDNAAALTTMFQTMAVAPALQIPQGIMDLITERIATILELDEGAVNSIVQDAAQERAKQVQQQAPPGMPGQSASQLGALSGATDAATNIVAKALKKAAGDPGPGIMNQPYSSPQVSNTGAGSNQGAT